MHSTIRKNDDHFGGTALLQLMAIHKVFVPACVFLTVIVTASTDNNCVLARRPARELTGLHIHEFHYPMLLRRARREDAEDDATKSRLVDIIVGTCIVMCND